MFTMRFLKDAVERAVKTAAQAYIGVWVALDGASWDDLGSVDNLKVAGAAAVVSLLTSVASTTVGDKRSASAAV